MRRKVSANDWRFPRRMTRKQWSVLPYRVPARLPRAGAMQPARLLARLRQRALPPCAPLPRTAPLLLGSQADDGAGGMGESRRALPAAARTSLPWLAERLGGAVAVLILSSLRNISPLIPAQAGIQIWVPAFAGTSEETRAPHPPSPRPAGRGSSGARTRFYFPSPPCGRGWRVASIASDEPGEGYSCPARSAREPLSRFARKNARSAPSPAGERGRSRRGKHQENSDAFRFPTRRGSGPTRRQRRRRPIRRPEAAPDRPARACSPGRAAQA